MDPITMITQYPDTPPFNVGLTPTARLQEIYDSVMEAISQLDMLDEKPPQWLGDIRAELMKRWKLWLSAHGR